MTLTEYYDLPLDKALLVSVKAVIFNANNEILFLQSPKGTSRWSEKWGFPGGLVEFGEKLTEALIREVKEEIGLKVQANEPYAVGSYMSDNFIFRDGRKASVHFVGIAFRCALDSQNDIHLSDEHTNYKWVSREELKNLPTSLDSEFVLQKLNFAS